MLENPVIGELNHLIVRDDSISMVYCKSTDNYGMLGRRLGDLTICENITESKLEVSLETTD